jgi:hypothetical protein
MNDSKDLLEIHGYYIENKDARERNNEFFAGILVLVNGDRHSAIKLLLMECIETSYERIKDRNEDAFFLTFHSDLVKIPNVRPPKDYSTLSLHQEIEHFLGSGKFDHVLGVATRLITSTRLEKCSSSVYFLGVRDQELACFGPLEQHFDSMAMDKRTNEAKTPQRQGM